MMDYRAIERRLRDGLGLARRPVAVAFRDTPPPGVKPFIGSEPSGCSFWRLAMEGRTFYTVPSDHYNCPVGSHTHNIPLPPERAGELPQVLEIMTGLGYLKMDEVPGIAQLPEGTEFRATALVFSGGCRSGSLSCPTGPPTWRRLDRASRPCGLGKCGSSDAV